MTDVIVEKKESTDGNDRSKHPAVRDISAMDLLQRLDVPNLSDSSDTDDFLQELAALNDAGLLRATMESLECGRLTPLIKEELRCRIQSRRLSEGKEELLVEFPSPTPSQPRPDEVQKRDRRREQNRRAAQKFRKKKKERGEHLIEETQRLECHNTTLLTEIKQLHEEREQLTRIIRSHASVCPLTPRQSPLTIIRESPVPGSIRESPLTLPLSAAASILAKSPVMGKSPVVVQSPVLLVPPTRESPVPLLILNPTRESPIPGRVIRSSPVPMSGRPRKSPVSILRMNQSPIPGEKFGDKSPIPFGSPPKQSKYSIPPRLNLAGPKPVVPILPKPTSNSTSTPSPKTPHGVTVSPLPTAPSPITTGSRAVHMSPVFFGEGCFTRSGRSRHVSQSPISITDSSNSSTPARITQQSPVFFGDRAPSATQVTPHFLQPSSASSSTSSSSSLASLIRQESPLSIISNSSGMSNSSAVYIGSSSFQSSSNGSLMDPVTTMHSSYSSNNSSSNNSSNSMPNISSNSLSNNTSVFGNINNQMKPPVFLGGSQSSARESQDDDVLCLEDIERSATGVEARDDLIDFIDIQALLELSGDQSAGAGSNDVGREQQEIPQCSSLDVSRTRNAFDSLTMNRMEDSMMDDVGSTNANLDSDFHHLVSADNCRSVCPSENALQSPVFGRDSQVAPAARLNQNMIHFAHQKISPEISQADGGYSCQGNDGGHFLGVLDNGQEGSLFGLDNCGTRNACQDVHHSAAEMLRPVSTFGCGQQSGHNRSGVGTTRQDMPTLKDYLRPTHHQTKLSPQTLAALQSSLRELLNAHNRGAAARRDALAETTASTVAARCLDNRDVTFGPQPTATTLNNETNNLLQQPGEASLAGNHYGNQLENNCTNDSLDNDYMNLQSSFSLDMLLSSPNLCSVIAENRYSQAGNQYT